MKTKEFVIQYDPSYSLGKMFSHFDQAIVGQEHLQPKNVVVFHDLSTIYSTITKARLDILTFLIAKQPANISQLAKLLKRHYAHVWSDCQALASLGIIELQKNEGEKEIVKPIALYEKIIFDFPVKNMVDLYNEKEILKTT